MQFPRLKPGLLLISLHADEFYIGESSEGVYIPSDPYLAIARACDGVNSTQMIAQHSNLPHGLVLQFLDELRSHNFIELRCEPIASATLDELANHYRERVTPEHQLFTWRTDTSDGGESEVALRKEFGIFIFGQNRLARSLLAHLQASGFSQTKIISPVSRGAKRIVARDICGITVRQSDLGVKESDCHREIIAQSQLIHGSNVDRPIHESVALAISTSAATSDYVQQWISEGIPHLQISQPTTHSLEIGPLVLPGLEACLNCVQLHRRDYLPPFIGAVALDNLMHKHGRELTAASTSFAAGVITPYICEFAARGSSSLISRSLTIDLLEPLHGITHHHWNVHPECGCGSSNPFTDQVSID